MKSGLERMSESKTKNDDQSRYTASNIGHATSGEKLQALTPMLSKTGFIPGTDLPKVGQLPPVVAGRKITLPSLRGGGLRPAPLNTFANTLGPPSSYNNNRLGNLHSAAP